jgi:archaemetzincin
VITIAVATAGAVEPEAADFAESCLASALGARTRRLDTLAEPEYAFDAARMQYSSTLMLRDALPRRPADAERMLVLTEKDIFIPMLSFVYGQAQLNGPVAVLSMARLRQEFYGLPPSRPLFLLRIRKEVMHEVGHTLGLTHCEDTLCAMALSTNLQQLDIKRGEYCDDCTVLVHDALHAAETSNRSGA